MKGTDLLHIFDYDAWATTTLLDAAAQLDASELNKDLGTSFQSLHGTLVHIYGAQLAWLRRWTGSTPSSLVTVKEVPTFEDLRQRWQILFKDLREYIGGLTQEQLYADFSYRDLTGKKSGRTHSSSKSNIWHFIPCTIVVRLRRSCDSSGKCRHTRT